MKVKVENVKKRFDSVQAVDGISFLTTEGKIFGLLGPNGAGKTTTIRMIMNIIAPDEGNILFDERAITAQDKNRIGYLPEERGLYKKMVVEDLLLYFASLKEKTGSIVRERITHWLKRFDLSSWRDKKVEKLSKGMTQKIQFIAAIAHDPDIVFLDEPFAGLDPIGTDVLREAILDLGRQGKTILFSTHIMDQAEKICEQILIIDHGREVLSGSLEDIKSQFGKNSVIIEFDGIIDFIRDSGIVSDTVFYPRWVETNLIPGKTPDDLLSALVGKVSIKRFEVVAPSLHKIFVEQVGGKVKSDE